MVINLLLWKVFRNEVRGTKLERESSRQKEGRHSSKCIVNLHTSLNPCQVQGLSCSRPCCLISSQTFLSSPDMCSWASPNVASLYSPTPMLVTRMITRCRWNTGMPLTCCECLTTQRNNPLTKLFFVLFSCQKSFSIKIHSHKEIACFKSH